ncbi:NAD(P)-dependent alcohol dehydrogenase [Haliea atlantica]
MEINAAVVREAGKDFSIESLQMEEPRKNEVLVRIVGVGICHTDIVARDQQLPIPLPAVLGHEGAGIVEKVGSEVRSVKPGDHVVLSYSHCGICRSCSRDNYSYCESFAPLNMSGGRADGSSALSSGGKRISGHFFGQSSFANFALAYEDNVVKVRNDAPLDLLGPLGCGIQTGAGAIMRAFSCKAGSSIVISGGGAVGLSAVLGAVVQGCNPIVIIEPHQNRRDLALELGATHVLDPLEIENLSEALLAIAASGFDYALDTSGIQPVISSVFNAMGLSGTLGLVGMPKPEASAASFDILTMILKGIKVKGICEGDADPQEFIPTLVDLYLDNKFPFDKLCQKFPFEKINEAVAAQHGGKCIKAICLI